MEHSAKRKQHKKITNVQRLLSLVLNISATNSNALEKFMHLFAGDCPAKKNGSISQFSAPQQHVFR